ncbi:MAG: type I-E CRISPR-associated protein Cse1/CasA, partial [Chloroflexi bacterium]|nr:type I-E CRISPR-associated protein Cse1/CasA [Chloroflexota bacterium]
EVSLREALTEARAIDELADVSPLTTIAIYRLLLAILHRVHGPRREPDWERMWQAGGWEVKPIVAYLEKCEPRFDLVDPARPFFQHPGIEAEWSPVQRLSHELGPANAGMFIGVPEGAPMTPGEAARYLLAYHLFSPGGLVGLQKREDREDRRRFKFARQAPLASSAVCLVTGQTLAETLLLNMVLYDPAEKRPFPSEPDDRPVWERDQPPQVVERRPTGLLDWLTWPCRRIRLRAVERDGRLMIDGVLIMKGDQLASNMYEAEFEQMVAYRMVPDAKPPQNPWPPIGFERDRVVWRDSSALVQSVAPEGKLRGQRRPRTLDALGNRILDDDEDATNALPIDLFGINLDQFNVLFWRHERLPVPPAYLRDAHLHEGLQRALRVAEDSARSLNAATRRLAELLLSRDPHRRPDPKTAAALAESMGVGRRYWARLGDHFTRFLQAQPAAGVAALGTWADEVRAAARAAFGEVSAGQAGDGWSLRAVVEAERELNIGLAGARRRIGDVEVTHAVV